MLFSTFPFSISVDKHGDLEKVDTFSGVGTTCVVVVDVKSNHMVQGMMVRFGHVIDVVVFTRCLVGCGPYGDGEGERIRFIRSQSN